MQCIRKRSFPNNAIYLRGSPCESPGPVGDVHVTNDVTHSSATTRIKVTAAIACNIVIFGTTFGKTVL